MNIWKWIGLTLITLIAGGCQGCGGSLSLQQEHDSQSPSVSQPPTQESERTNSTSNEDPLAKSSLAAEIPTEAEMEEAEAKVE